MPSTRFLKVLLGRHNPNRLYLFAWLLAAACSSVAAIGLITASANISSDAVVEFDTLGIFLLIAGLVIFSQNRALNVTVDVCETAVERLRSEFADAVSRADMRKLELLGSARLYGLLTRTTSVLSETGPPVISGLITCVVMLSIAVYTLYLSLLTFLVMLTISAAAIYAARHYGMLASPYSEQAQQAEQRSMDLHLQLLEGIGDIKLSLAARRDLLMHMQSTAALAHQGKIVAAQMTSRVPTAAFVGLYLLMAMVVFAVPQYLDDQQVITRLAYLTIFMLFFLNILIRAVAMLSRAEWALEEIDTVMANLVHQNEAESASLTSLSAEFKSIELQAVSIDLLDAAGCPIRIGPCSTRLVPGELIAVVAQAGSGRSTMLKVIAGLLKPDDGTVAWNGEPLQATALASYRNLFAAVFPSSRLLDRWYGLDEAAHERLRLHAGEFGVSSEQHSPALISDSQRIKLLLAVALARDTHILVLDDIEACQDLAFIEKLATELLPNLIRQGKTVVYSTTNNSKLAQIATQVIHLPTPTDR